MASKRPGFPRVNTEQLVDNGEIEMNDMKGPSKPSGYEYNDPDVKNGAFVDVERTSDEDGPPRYEDGGDGFAKASTLAFDYQEDEVLIAGTGHCACHHGQGLGHPGHPRRRRPHSQPIHFPRVFLG